MNYIELLPVRLWINNRFVIFIDTEHSSHSPRLDIAFEGLEGYGVIKHRYRTEGERFYATPDLAIQLRTGSKEDSSIPQYEGAHVTRLYVQKCPHYAMLMIRRDLCDMFATVWDRADQNGKALMQAIVAGDFGAIGILGDWCQDNPDCDDLEMFCRIMSYTRKSTNFKSTTAVNDYRASKSKDGVYTITDTNEYGFTPLQGKKLQDQGKVWRP